MRFPRNAQVTPRPTTSPTHVQISTSPPLFTQSLIMFDIKLSSVTLAIAIAAVNAQAPMYVVVVWLLSVC